MMLRTAIFALFFLSGMAGLIYQVVWTKLLTLTFGVTVLAVSTVLTCFFGGLALGSFLGGRWVDKHPDGFKWYGAAEALIGLYALAFMPLLGVNNSVYVHIARASGLGLFGLTLLKFALSAILLFIPTLLMGATLPILSKSIARSSSTIARDIGGLYGINTVGAVAGAVLTAFFLIPNFGIKAIIYSAGALNIFIGASAILLGRSNLKAGPEKEAAIAPSIAEDALPRRFTGLLLLSFWVLGFTGLAYEIMWTRVLGFILTGTIYAFATVLAVFLTGIAAGSFLFSRLPDRMRSGRLVNTFAAIMALIGLSSIGLIILYDRIPSFGFYHTLGVTRSWGEFIYLNFFIPFLTLIVPTFLFGGSFPFACRLYARRKDDAGRRIGNIYSINTVGGILGSFAGGFILIPLFGVQKAIVLLGFSNIVTGAALLAFNPFGGRLRYAFTAAPVAFGLALLFFLPADMSLTLHKSLLSFGEEIVFYREGAAATVMIAEKPGSNLNTSNKRIWINGNRATAAFYEGLQINRFQGVLPMVLHPDPKDVLVICFGSGTTFGTLSQFTVNRVDNVEIARTVIEGAPQFTKENMDVLHNPRSRVNIDDGRSFLETTPRKFDVITEEPMHPALAGVVNLYTKEYYELAKAHLKEGGIISQWIPLYNLSISDVKTMVRTFQSVFPHTTVWIANTDIFMIGSPDAARIDFARLRQRIGLENIRALLTPIDLEAPYEFLNTFLMNEDMVREYAGDAPVMSDDMPIVEFTGPRSLNVNTVSPNIAELLKYREPVAPYLDLDPALDAEEVKRIMDVKFAGGKWNLIGRAYFADSNYPMASQYFKSALVVDPTDRTSLHYKQKLKIFWGQPLQ
ncbi:MAG: fused MFS/spermidine synthase [Deltaproteobacteria bacterium]|nr:fused MFS/spermidine synthase [Deltaproteobacteria bacterium]